ncbi:MAG TPA: DUF3857 domain-containing protein [Bacteroidales bacterium]|nr:DUF3857 domain-containing protein [Bacteroidales bacterium]
MRKEIPWLILLILGAVEPVRAQEYSVSAIPDSLKENANCIVREFTTTMNVSSVNSGVEKVKQVFTVFNRDGEEDVILKLFYDKNASVNIRQIIFYDAGGKKIKQAKQSEIEDYPAYVSFELFSENRVKIYKPVNADLPYTIEFDYEIRYSNMISLGRWMPEDTYRMSVQHASYELTHPENIKINRREFNLKIKSSESEGGWVTEKWELSGIKAIEREPFGAPIIERASSLCLMPEVILFDKYEGKADSWKNYGKWVYDLYEGKDEIPETETTKIASLVKESKDTLEIMRKLYKHMQDNTRYVAVILGIGGYQPFDVSSVIEKGYGECKALSNYMYSMLRYAGIKAFPALASAGSYRPPVYKDFPNFSQFNHVIVCVPFRGDTIWLECTDQRIPFGFLGDFTDDRDALLITPSGGKFAHTTRYKAEDNLHVTKTEISVDPSGNADFNTVSRYTGIQYDDAGELVRSRREDQKKWLYSKTELPSLQIKEFGVEETPAIIPAVRLTESGTSKSYASFSGKYMVLPLNLMNVQGPVQKMLKERQSDIITGRPSIDCDTTIFRLPQGFEPESLPDKINLKSDFGSYSSVVSFTGKELIYTRKLEIYGGRFSSSRYRDFYTYVMSVSKADKSKVLLVKKV